MSKRSLVSAVIAGLFLISGLSFGEEVVNPGFETGNDGWNNLLGGRKIVAENPYSGLFALKISATTSYQAVSQDITPVTGGEELEVSGYAKSVGLAAGKSGLFQIRYYDAGGSRLRIDGIGTVQETADYTFFTQTVTAPENTAYLQVWLAQNGGAQGAVYFDDISVKRAGTPPVALPAVNAGLDVAITLPGNTVQLAGSITYNGTASASWSVISGPAGAVFSDLSSLTSSVQFPGEGIYVLRLTAVTENNDTVFDELTVTVNPAAVTPPAAGNILLNPGFEEGETAWSPFNSSRRITNDNVYEGSKAVKIISSTAYLALTQRLAVAPGDQYEVSGYISSANLADGKSALFQVRIYDAGGTRLRIDSIGSAAGTQAYARYSANVTIPDGAAFMDVLISQNGGVQGEAYFDSFSVIRLNGGTDPGPVDTTPPSTPVLTLNSFDSTSVKLTWTAAVDPESPAPITYEIYRNGVKLIAIQDVTDFTDSAVAVGQTYAYKVIALNNLMLPSNASNEITVMIEEPADPPAFLAFGQEQAVGNTDLNNSRVDWFINIGQSNNIGGYGGSAALDRVTSPEVWNIRRTERDAVYLAAEPLEDNGAAFIGNESALRIGYALPFCRNIRAFEPDLLEGNKIGLYRLAVGGTSFSSNPGWSATPGAEGNLYLQLLAAYPEIMSNFPNFRPRAILAHLGEEDVVSNWTQAQYEAAALEFCTNVRAAFNIPDLPIIFGTMCTDAITHGLQNPILLGQKNLPNLIPFVGLADMGKNGESGYATDTSADAVGIDDEYDIDPAIGVWADNNVHFAAPSHRNFINYRYIAAFKFAEDNNNPGGTKLAQDVPSAPAGLSATAHDGYCTIGFAIPDNGNAPIRSYEVRLSANGGSTWNDYSGWLNNPGGKIIGLTNGVEYSIQIRAINKIGHSNWSASVMVVPASGSTVAREVIPLGTAVLETDLNKQYDLFVIAGQSNTKSGRFVVPDLDRVRNDRTWMIMTYANSTPEYQGKIVAAAEPMYDAGTETGKISYGKSFADTIIDREPQLFNQRDVLMFSFGHSGSGFTTNRKDKQPIEGIDAERPSVGNWLPDEGDLYPALINRLTALLAANPNVRVAGILWHQGEADTNTLTKAQWEATIGNFINRLRTDLSSPNLPFVCGGMVPMWRRNDPLKIARQDDLKNLQSWMPYTAYADPEVKSPYETAADPDELGLDDESEGTANDATHYAASSQRLFGKRYVEAYLKALVNTGNK